MLEIQNEMKVSLIERLTVSEPGVTKKRKKTLESECLSSVNEKQETAKH